MRRLLVLGANSLIAVETCRLFAAQGDRFFLASRNAERLARHAEALRSAGAAQVATRALDLTDRAGHAALWQEAQRALGGIDVLFIAHGLLGDQKADQDDVEKARRILETNFLSAADFLTLVASDFEKQGHGTIAVIASVAGDRGRRSNYLYGAAKGGLAHFLEGLRNRLHPSGVHVLTIKPGLVDTPMIAHMKKGALTARADRVARGIYRAIVKRRDVVYVPGFWRLIMACVRAVPECVFKRLKL